MCKLEYPNILPESIEESRKIGAACVDQKSSTFNCKKFINLSEITMEIGFIVP